jgi:hypothetical protein
MPWRCTWPTWCRTPSGGRNEGEMTRLGPRGAVVILLLAACGGGSSTANTTTAPPSTATTATAPVTTGAPVTTTSGATSTTSVAPSTTQGPIGDGDLELGRFIWEEYYLEEGCQKCHGLDARGTADGPDIRGASRTKIVDALLDVEEMEWGTQLTSSEIDAVHAYLTYLSSLPEA